MVFVLRPENKELVQGPGMGRANTELMEQHGQSPEVGMRCPGEGGGHGEQ